MALKEYEVDGQTYLFDEEDPLRPKHAKLVEDVEVIAETPAAAPESVQDEGDSTVPEDADPAPVEDSHPVKRGRRTANKQAEAPADK
jgi:hypothetical protein